jgi:hypothetical protein
VRSHALSMSKADLALGALDEPATGCLYGFRADATRLARPSGDAAQVGSVVHDMADRRVKKLAPLSRSMTVYSGDIIEKAADLFKGPIGPWLDSRPWTASELGLRYDAENDSTVVGPRRGEPGYEAHGAMVLPGTLDLVHVVDREAWVPDLKTGKKDNAHPEQLYAQAVAVSRLYGVTTVHVGFAFVRKRLSPEPQWETLNEDRLDEEAGKIRRALRMLPTAEPKRGDWCWRCDARPACPAFEGTWTVSEPYDTALSF